MPQILKAVLLVLAFDTVDKKLKLPVGQYLKELAEAQHVEVEAPLEFGNANIDGKNEILLADEISPDTCRLWDVVSEKKLDKDRFRKDLGNIIQAYQEVARRLGITHEESNISTVKFGKPKAVNLKKK